MRMLLTLLMVLSSKSWAFSVCPDCTDLSPQKVKELINTEFENAAPAKVDMLLLPKKGVATCSDGSGIYYAPIAFGVIEQNVGPYHSIKASLNYHYVETDNIGVLESVELTALQAFNRYFTGNNDLKLIKQVQCEEDAESLIIETYNANIINEHPLRSYSLRMTKEKKLVYKAGFSAADRNFSCIL